LVTLKPRYEENLAGFEYWLTWVARKAPATVTAYMASVRRYAAVAHDGSGDPVRRYLAARAQRLAPASLNLEISALRCWFGYLVRLDPGAWQPDGFPRMRRGPQRLPRALSDAEVGTLLGAPDLSTFVGFRDHVIMATLYQCGLRASELVRLEVGDVQLDGVLRVHGKGGKYRLVPYGGAWRGLLEHYLQRRHGARPGRHGRLFVTVHGRPLRDGRSVWVIVNRYARRALGTACGFTRLEAARRGRPWAGHYPHLMRAAFATELLKGGLDILSIAQLMGHASAETTAHYIGLDLGTLREAAARHPRAKRQDGGN
jgi:site-specific recombinase XerD